MTPDIRTITGTVDDASGAPDINLAHFGTMMTMVRFLDEIGNPIILNRLLSPNSLASYLKAGTNLTAHLFKFKKNWVLFAIEVDGNKLFDPKGVESLGKAFRMSGLLTGCMLPILAIGFFFIPWVGWILSLGMLYLFYTLVFAQPGYFDPSRLRPYLKKRGFTDQNESRVLS